MFKCYSYNPSDIDEYEAAHEFDLICSLYVQMKTVKVLQRNAKDKAERKSHKERARMIEGFIFRELDQYVKEVD